MTHCVKFYSNFAFYSRLNRLLLIDLPLLTLVVNEEISESMLSVFALFSKREALRVLVLFPWGWCYRKVFKEKAYKSFEKRCGTGTTSHLNYYYMVIFKDKIRYCRCVYVWLFFCVMPSILHCRFSNTNITSYIKKC